jgi:hypothetical protein
MSSWGSCECWTVSSEIGKRGFEHGDGQFGERGLTSPELVVTMNRPLDLFCQALSRTLMSIKRGHQLEQG